jgi:hypothetical protein
MTTETYVGVAAADHAAEGMMGGPHEETCDRSPVDPPAAYRMGATVP